MSHEVQLRMQAPVAGSETRLSVFWESGSEKQQYGVGAETRSGRSKYKVLISLTFGGVGCLGDSVN